jgi:hypothetical protein
MEKEQYKRIADFYREFMIFFAVLFFTCVVGIITLLPELEHPYGLLSWGWLSLSVLYFGLLLGIDYSLHKCFYLYFLNREIREEFGFGFYYPEIDYLVKKIFKRIEALEGFLLGEITVVFLLLYIVKLGVLH